MNNLALSNREVRMTSVEVVEMINRFREMEDNKAQLRHDNLMSKIKKEYEMAKSLGFEGQQYFAPSSYINSQNKEQPCYSISKEGLKHLIDVTKSTDRIPMQKAYESIGGDYTKVICMNRFETTFFSKLEDTLSALDIELVREFNVLDYRVDGYIPQYNIVIEYDEAQHFVEPQKSKDIDREKKITKQLKCKIVRLNYQNTDAFNIGLIVAEIMKVNKKEEK